MLDSSKEHGLARSTLSAKWEAIYGANARRAGQVCRIDMPGVLMAAPDKMAEGKRLSPTPFSTAEPKLGRATSQ